MNNRLVRLVPYCLVALLAACGGPSIQGVASVEVAGGDRSVTLGHGTLLTATVVAGSGVDTAVTWTSSDESVVRVDASGLVTTHSLGSATVTATSVADSTRSDAVVISVVAPTVTDDGAFLATLNLTAGTAPVLAAGLLLVDDTPAPLAVVELFPGYWSGPVGPVGSDDTVVIQLPPAVDLPESVMAPAGEFLLNIGLMADCELVATVPTAHVTYARIGSFATPGVVLYGSEGAIPGMVTNIPVFFGAPPALDVLEALEVVTWLYADAATSITTTGTDCLDPDYMQTLSVDIDLDAGWNQLSWRFVLDETDAITGVALGASSVDEYFITPIPAP